MRLEHLHYVLEIERCKSMSRASRNLYITQQSLSYAIKTLEGELGISILDRRGQGCKLTEEGTLFSDFCRNVLAEWEIYQQRLEEHYAMETSRKIGGELTLYTNMTFETFILPDILDTFMMRYPNVHIKTVPIDASEGASISMEDDFVWLLNLPRTAKQILPYPAFDHDQFSFHTLINNRCVLLVNHDSPLAEKRAISLKTSLQYPWIYHGMSGKDKGAMKETPLSTVVQYYGDYDISVEVQTESCGIFLNIVAAGKGIGIAVDKVVDKMRVMYPRPWENISVLMTKEYLGYASGYAVRKEGMTELEKAFVDFLVENI